MLRAQIGELESTFIAEAKVPGPWQEILDAEGKSSYWNSETGETQREKPANFGIDNKKRLAPPATPRSPEETPEQFAKRLEDALSPWKKVETSEGDSYWHNQDTDEKSKVPPPRVPINPIISQTLARISQEPDQLSPGKSTNRRAATRLALLALLRRTLDQLEQLELEDHTQPEEKQPLVEGALALLERKESEDDFLKPSDLLMVMSSPRRGEETEGRMRKLQEQNVVLVRRLLDSQEDRCQLSAKVIQLLEKGQADTSKR